MSLAAFGRFDRSPLANFRLTPAALGDSQKNEKTSNLWNGCRFGIFNFVSVTFTLVVKGRDLIVNDLQFCS